MYMVLCFMIFIIFFAGWGGGEQAKFKEKRFSNVCWVTTQYSVLGKNIVEINDWLI